MNDNWCALTLLSGYLRRKPNNDIDIINSEEDLPEIIFLSDTTKPTEKEARRALCRILRNKDEKPPQIILDAIADVFDPDEQKTLLQMPKLKAVLERRSQGHPNSMRDAAIASAVHRLRTVDKKKYEDAIQQIADAIGKSPEQVKRIYSNAPGMKALLRASRKTPSSIR